MILFIVTSTIHVGQATTVFTAEQRLAQTVHTVNSIKTKVPDAIIYLFESSPLSNDEACALRATNANVINLSQSKFVTERSNHCNQSIGEIAMMHCALTYLNNNKLLDGVDNIIKISGRYYLNDSFDVSVFRDKYTFKMFNENGNTWLSTMLYGVPKCKFAQYCGIIEKGVNGISVNIEMYFRQNIADDDVDYVEVIGGSGCISHCGVLVSH